MKTFLKAAIGLVVASFVLLALLMYPIWGWFYDTEVAAIKIDEEKEIIFLAMEDDSPSIWVEVIFRIDGRETDRIPVAFLVEDRSDISHKLTVKNKTKETIEFRYVGEFEVIDYSADLSRGVFTKNDVKVGQTEMSSNQSLDTTRAKRPSCGRSKDISHPTLSRRLPSPRVSA